MHVRRRAARTWQMLASLDTLQTVSATCLGMASRSACSVSMPASSALCSSAAATQFSLAFRSASVRATSPQCTCTRRRGRSRRSARAGVCRCHKQC